MTIGVVIRELTIDKLMKGDHHVLSLLVYRAIPVAYYVLEEIACARVESLLNNVGSVRYYIFSGLTSRKYEHLRNFWNY